MFLIIENIKSAIEILGTNKLRTFLTVLGIIIGVSAVIMIGGIAKSGKAVIFQELETFGLKSLWVYTSIGDTMPGKSQRKGYSIDNEDIETLRNNDDYFVSKISAILVKDKIWVKYNGNYSLVRLVATDSNYQSINNDSITIGRPLMEEDIKFKREVCIIGPDVLDKLFRNEIPIGKEIKMDEDKYTIVGVLKKKDREFIESIGAGAGDNANMRVIIPISVYQHKYNTKAVALIQAEAKDISLARRAADSIIETLKRRHKGEYTYGSMIMQQYIETTNRILDIVSWIGGLAAAISLIVGGIGIMNIMTASVIERTREIGIRKSIGAKNIDILMQFLSETVVISVTGGIIGIIFGLTCVIAIQFLNNKPILFATEYIIISVIMSIIVGVLSGVYPAMRAARLDPVDALRYE